MPPFLMFVVALAERRKTHLRFVGGTLNSLLFLALLVLGAPN
jgi:hypothetical protein